MMIKEVEAKKRIAYKDIEILSGIQAKSKIPEIYQGKIDLLKEQINRLEKRTPRK